MAPKEEAVPYNVAPCLAWQGYYRNATSWYEEVLRRNPQHPRRTDIQATIRRLRGG